MHCSQLTAVKIPDSLKKSVVKILLSFAGSNKERKCLRYAIYSGMTPTQARHKYGFQNVRQNAIEVEAALAGVQSIREAISDIANVEDASLLKSFGLDVENTSMCSSCESDEEVELSQLDDVNISEILEVHDIPGLLQKADITGLSLLITCCTKRYLAPYLLLFLMPLSPTAILTSTLISCINLMRFIL